MWTENPGRGIFRQDVAYGTSRHSEKNFRACATALARKHVSDYLLLICIHIDIYIPYIFAYVYVYINIVDTCVHIYNHVYSIFMHLYSCCLLYLRYPYIYIYYIRMYIRIRISTLVAELSPRLRTPHLLHEARMLCLVCCSRVCSYIVMLKLRPPTSCRPPSFSIR